MSDGKYKPRVKKRDLNNNEKERRKRASKRKKMIHCNDQRTYVLEVNYDIKKVLNAQKHNQQKKQNGSKNITKSIKASRPKCIQS